MVSGLLIGAMALGSAAVRMEVLGVHAVSEAPEPCYLVEMVIHAAPSDLDLGAFSQGPLAGIPAQAPWLETFLDRRGERRILDPFAGPAPHEVRLAFFLHYVDLSRPLGSPYGPVMLPPPTPRPRRLAFITYREPD